VNAEQPAYPFAFQGPTTAPETYYGLTKREYFAAMAMQGILCHKGISWKISREKEVLIELTTAKDAIAEADSLIAELSKTETK